MRSKIKKLEFYRGVALENGSFAGYVEETVGNAELLAKSVHNTIKIEGNTITYNDTLKLLLFGIGTHEVINKYKKEEILEVEGIKNATVYSYEHIGDKLDEELIMNMHRLSYGPAADIHKGIFPGQYRNYASYTYRVDGTKKEYLDYRFIYDAMEDLIFYYEKSNKTLIDICKLKLDFIHIHPFGDGNGRVSRILLNWALISSGYIPVIIEWGEKREYIGSMDYYGSIGDTNKFLEYIVNKLENQYEKILNTKI